MLKNKKTVILLITIALAVWGVNVVKIITGINGSKAIQVKTQAKMVATNPDNIDSVFSSYDENGRDIFRPVEKKVTTVPKILPSKDAGSNITVKLPDWRLEGVMWNDRDPMVVLRFGTTDRTEMVKQNSVVDDVKIMKIERNKVHVQYKGTTFVIE